MSVGFKCLFHLHTAKETIKVKKIKGKYDDKNNLNTKVKFLSPG